MIYQINNKLEIENLFNDVFNTKLETTIYSKIIAYKIENKIVGFCIYDAIYERYEIEYIAVANSYRKQNIASILLEYIINEAKQNNILNISLEVSKENIPAINLYKKYDFKIEAIRKKYYDNKDAYLMVKEV